ACDTPAAVLEWTSASPRRRRACPPKGKPAAARVGRRARLPETGRSRLAPPAPTPTRRSRRSVGPRRARLPRPAGPRCRGRPRKGRLKFGDLRVCGFEDLLVDLPIWWFDYAY